MTTNNPVRRTGRRTTGNGSNGNGNGNGRVHVGDRLRDAREVQGLDLYRVERDTKIRHKFLVALEAGDYADLPGDVYARGFLRNYATYLGLDPDEIVDDWRTESGPKSLSQPLLGAPRPMVLPRRGFFLQTSHMVLIAVVLIVAVVAVYFGYQVTRFLSYPTLSVGCPGAQSSGAPGGSGVTIATAGATACTISQGSVHITAAMGATTYFLSGSATANSTVTIVWNGQEPKTMQADDGGHWSYQAVLVPGQNEFDVTAQNIDTNHASKVVKIYIFVPSSTPSPSTPVVAFQTPADLSIVADGKVAIAGTSSSVTDVTLTTTYLGVPPAPGATLAPVAASPGAGSSSSPGAGVSPTPTPKASPTPPTAAASAPAPPPPVSTPVDSDGNFTFNVQLETGTWRLSLVGADTQGHKSAIVSRVVAVPFTGVVVVVTVRGSSASVAYTRDGALIASNVLPDGSTFTVTAKKSVCINTPKNKNVFFTVNGTDMGSVAQYGGRRVLIDATHPPKNVASC